ncbi:hypothetical protein [Pseudomonas aeruginosa]|uniref:hypothetical protein n=1 Tax=Pseudomonas aeruginosa TaxID=287 RepID=UPI00233E612C|nr:hypothetical protein [Pseudomonas aeruginosa]WCI65305.1 hypothetical protein PMJ94_11440 [Pseudomonas aeruginosa]
MKNKNNAATNNNESQEIERKDELRLTMLEFINHVQFDMNDSDIEMFLDSNAIEQVYIYSLIISLINKDGFKAKKLTNKSRRNWSKIFSQLSVEALEKYNRTKQAA